MGFLSRLFRADSESIYKTCIGLYEKARRKRPGKSERDYLKLILLTKPPFDYQADLVINEILKENQTIEELAIFIARSADPENREVFRKAFEIRERNLKTRPFLKDRN